MNSVAKYLKWDSKFFEFPVYKIDYTSDFEFERELSLNNDQKVLYYVFSEGISLSANMLEKYNGKLVDEKVVLRKQELKCKKTFLNNIELYEEKTPTHELFQLAKMSGEFSRFKTDKRLPNFTFEKMYNLWIENSCKNENSIVYVCKHEHKIVGFITLDISLNTGSIGLIAVESRMQGNGIGYELMCKAENHLIGLGINNISVATQKDNENALNFYSRLGYKVENISNIYHFILKNKNIENSF